MKCANCHTDIPDISQAYTARDQQGNIYYLCQKSCMEIFIYCAEHIAHLAHNDHLSTLN